MSFDNLRQDLRLAVRGLLRAPAFAAVTILTLALGIGANTAIFSIVNGVILRPLGYPKPEQLMYLTTQFAAQKFDQFWVSPPEYFEFRELNQSFSAVGAYTTGEVNLTAGDRPLRVRSAGVDDALLAALGIQPLYGRLFAKGETDVVPPPNATGPDPAAGDLHPVVRAVANRVWRAQQRDRRDGRDQRLAPRSDRHHAARRGRDGQPHRDLDADWAQSQQPPPTRQPLPLSRRPVEGWCLARDGQRRVAVAHRQLGRTDRAEEPRLPAAAEECGGGEDQSRAHPADARRPGADCWRRQPRHLGAAGGRGVRAADRVRESCQPDAGARRNAASRVRRAHRARRRPRSFDPAVHDRRRVVVVDWRDAGTAPGSRRHRCC